MSNLKFVKKLSFITCAVLILITCLSINIFSAEEHAKEQEIKLQDIEPITQKDNILILAPHPDDESLGCAGIIQRALKAGARVNVVYLTNGDSNQIAFIVYEKRLVFKKRAFLHMGEVRRKEAIAAMKSLGLPQENLIFLGYPDFGTMAIFRDYWNNSRPFKSLLTRVSSVPYPENFSFGKPYKAESILMDIKELLKKIKPNKIFVTTPIDTNADHRAFYLFLRVALLDLGEEFSKNIRVYGYLIHHLRWPEPRHFHPEFALNPPQDLMKSENLWFDFDLNDEEIKNKHKAILAYKSQTESSAFYLLSFVRKNELFLNSPDIKIEDQSDDGLVWSSKFEMLMDKEESASLKEDMEVELDTSAISFSQKQNSLFVKITPRRQPFLTSLSVYLYGYKKQVAFNLMPKIRVKITGDTINVLSQNKRLEAGVSLKREGREIIISLPLKILNDPEILFCSVNTSRRSLSHDSNTWSVVDMKKNGIR